MKATIVSTYFLNGHVYAMDENEAILEAVEPTRRRRHSKEFKEKVIRAAMQPNVSIAAVALHYRLNANLLRRWVAASGGVGRSGRGTPVAELAGGGVHPAATGGAGRDGCRDRDSDRDTPGRATGRGTLSDVSSLAERDALCFIWCWLPQAWPW
ncbi:transposase [Burkholderia ambifaria]|uniref:transposase n=1 Tax=Burkholderia ambifaria TaxID=152480 RepID=UPI001E38683D|nr:transposase [Burkholderia ambifaria]